VLGNRSPHFGTNPREPAVRAQPPDPVAMQLSLVVELIADSRVFNLNCREADVAFRLARPTASAMGVMARRIGTSAGSSLQDAVEIAGHAGIRPARCQTAI
jgi:hypothetical protein